MKNTNMITIYNDDMTIKEVLHEVRDIRELLNGKQTITSQLADAIKMLKVFGTKDASFEKVLWRRNDNHSVYKDYIFTFCR